MRTASQPEESISIFSIRNPQFSRTTLNCKVCFHISADGERRRSAPRNCATIKAHGIGKDIAAEGGGSGGALQNDPRRRPGGGGALGRERFGDAAGGAAAVAEAARCAECLCRLGPRPRDTAPVDRPGVAWPA